MTNPAFAIHRVMHAEPFRVLLIKEQISAVCTQANILYATFSLVVWLRADHRQSLRGYEILTMLSCCTPPPCVETPA